MTGFRSVRARVTVVAGIVVAVVLAVASLAILRLVERDVSAAATEAVRARLGALAESGGGATADVTASGDTITVDGEHFTFGVFERRGELAFGTLSIDGVETAAVELNLTTGTVNELRNPTTGTPLDDPELRSEVAELALVIEAADDDLYLVDAPSPDGIEVSTAAVRRALAVIVPLVVAAAAALAWVLVGQSLRPVDRLIDDVDSIHTDNLSFRLSVPETGDEISRLARVMNAVLGRLEAGDGRQRQFTGDASHELRSPLATIRVNAELLASHADDPERARRADAIVGTVDRMDELLDRLLHLARIDATGAPTEPVDLAAVVSPFATTPPSTAAAPEPPADDERSPLDTIEVAVTVDNVDGTTIVAGNKDDLTRLVDNLVANAVRHARSKVAIRLVADPVSLVVDDDGPGIPAADRDRAFDRFARLDDARGRGDGGTGLGLPIVRSIADAHGATVAITDAAIGGARFTVTFPPYPQATGATPSPEGPAEGKRSAR